MLKEIKTDYVHCFVNENGLRQGEYKQYYNTGELYIHILHGEYNVYYDNCQLCEHVFYVNGKLHGEYKSYYNNGRIHEHSLHQYGKLHGEYRTYNENGRHKYATFFYQGTNLNVKPDTLTEKDKAYIMLSGRLPHRG